MTGGVCRLATYVAALVVGGTLLLGVPRTRGWWSDLGTRTVYGYLLHAPVLLGVLAASGTFRRAGDGGERRCRLNTSA